MMARRRIVLATGGSLGDIHPMIALGLALQAQGAQAEIATSLDYRAKIEAAGLTFREVGPDLDRLRADTGLGLAELTRRIAEDSRFLFGTILLAYVEEATRQLLAICEGASAVVGSTFAPGAAIAAERLGLPLVVVALQPTTVFSAYDPPLLPQAPWMRPANGGLGLALNRVSLSAARASTAGWTRAFDAVRAGFGLGPAGRNIFIDALAGADLGLGLYSPLLSPRQPDAPERFQVVGYAPYDSDDGAASALPPDLSTFLDAEAPPVVFTLGSAAVNIPGDFYREGLKAARRLGRRSVLLVGPDGDPSVADGADAIALPYAPYSLLFPRAAAIVHQGGVGTTQQALRSGRPQVIVPHLGDQPDNAARIARLGCGRVLRRAAYARRIETDLRAVLDDPAMAARAETLGETARREDGAAEAARRVMALI